jgi:hypothetical protein
MPSLAAARDRLDDRLAAAVQRRVVEAADLAQAVDRLRAALGDLHQRGVVQHRGHRAVAGPRRLLAPLDELAGDRALVGVQRVDARQLAEDDVEVAAVVDLLERAALLAGPVQAAELGEPVLQGGGDLEQVQDVLAGVAELLLGERAVVPARERRGLPQPDAERLLQQRLVAELGAHAGEPRGDLRVEDVADRLAPVTAQQRDVLAGGVQDDLDLGVGEHVGQRRGVVVLGQRVQDDDLGAALAVVERDLGEAEQGLVAALAHELRVDAEPPGLPGARGDVGGRPRHMAAHAIRSHARKRT